MATAAFGQPPPFFTVFFSQSHCSLFLNECEHPATAGAACLAFQVPDLPTVLCEDVATVTVSPHLEFACQKQ